MNQRKPSFSTNFKAFRGSTLRRLRSTPNYFFLIWRWGMWLDALVVIAGSNQFYKVQPVYQTTVFLLLITLVQSILVTLYAPVLHILSSRHKPLSIVQEDEETDIVSPIARTHNQYWDIAVYTIDVLICGIVIYYSGPFGLKPNFGVGSPFYRYGLSTVLAVALAYQYRGGIAAALGLSLFVVLGILVPAPGSTKYIPNVIDITASLIDAPIIAILLGYVASLLKSLTISRHELQLNARVIQNSARRETYLRSVVETLVRTAHNKQDMLQKSAEQTRQGGQFHAVLLALPSPSESNSVTATCIESTVSGYQLSEKSLNLLEQVMQSGQKYQLDITEQDDTARLYLPFFKQEKVQIVLGVESKQRFSTNDELFLTTVGTQLLVALENIRLTEQTIELAASAERGRIAREIHDGVAQLVYMLSLSAETCSAQIHRITEASEEDTERLQPLVERLDKQVLIAKQALWETRTYMFTLKPLISGSSTLTQMLTNQLQEFETISGLSTQLEVVGNETEQDLDSAQRMAQVGTAIFRIVQEALTNAYKHAQASRVSVRLTLTTTGYTVEICDDGLGLPQTILSSSSSTDSSRIYSGHGLNGMRERAQELGGTMQIAQLPQGGVKVSAWLPL